MKKIIPFSESKRAETASYWVDASMPMYSISKKMDATNLKAYSDEKKLSFTMLMNYCAAKTASQIPEFYALPEEDHFIQYDRFSVRVTFLTKDNNGAFCDLPADLSLSAFNQAYIDKREKAVHDMDENTAHLDTSALPFLDFDAVSSGYSKVFRSPFLVWGKYSPVDGKWKMPVSFKFDHTQMDGYHAALFLNALQEAMNQLR